MRPCILMVCLQKRRARPIRRPAGPFRFVSSCQSRCNLMASPSALTVISPSSSSTSPLSNVRLSGLCLCNFTFFPLMEKVRPSLETDTLPRSSSTAILRCTDGSSWGSLFAGLFLVAMITSSPILAVIEEWTLTTLPIRFRKENVLLDSLPHALDELQKTFPVRVSASGLVSYQLRILSLQDHVQAEAGIP